MTESRYKDSATIKLLNKVNILWHFGSLNDFWIIDAKLPSIIKINYTFYYYINFFILIAFIIMSAGAFATQTAWSKHQEHRTAIGILGSGSILFYRFVLTFYKAEVKQILYHLTVSLKGYNNRVIEQKMLSKIKRYAGVFSVLCIVSLLVRGSKAVFEVSKGGLFVPFVTMWPDIKDPSPGAETARIITYFVWYIIVIQLMAVLMMLTIILASLSHQYENLTVYFYELNEIFNDKTKSQEEKEEEYETGLRKGLRDHTLTLWCVDNFQHVCKIIFNIHLTFGSLILIFLLPETLNPEVDTRVKLAQTPVFIALLLYIGFIMWIAGDITVEASKLADGLFFSGWQNCTGRRSIKVRKMIVFAMQQAQQPVTLKAFGTFELSYNSYVTIVKSSYSVFSVIAI